MEIMEDLEYEEKDYQNIWGIGDDGNLNVII
jgi:hypothetical protein